MLGTISFSWYNYPFVLNFISAAAITFKRAEHISSLAVEIGDCSNILVIFIEILKISVISSVTTVALMKVKY